MVLTVPLTDETRGMIDARRLALMGRDAVLVDVARGPLTTPPEWSIHDTAWPVC